MRKEYISSAWVLLDNWSVLIKDAHAKGEEILRETETILRESKVPDIEIERVKVVQSGLAGLFSKTKEREYLEVTNKDLGHYTMFIGTRDYGNSLDVQWYLIRKPHKKIKEAIKSAPKELRRGITGLNIFEQQDLTAYVTSVHHSLLEAVDNLMKKLGQDPSKINRKSKGFLGVS
jgi:hypothetical protein